MDRAWLSWLLFSFKGRMQRVYFWVTSLVVGVVASMVSSTMESIAQSFGFGFIDPDTNAFELSVPLSVLLSVVGVLNLWINYALAAKRLHDRNLSGWWLLAPTATFLVALAFAFVTLSLPDGQREPWNTIGIIFVFVTVAIGVWLFLEIGFLRGTQERNRFGPDPLAGEQGSAPAKLT
ncbi:MAG: DUF805 domain-containing protein [Actinomycetota bacterium]